MELCRAVLKVFKQMEKKRKKKAFKWGVKGSFQVFLLCLFMKGGCPKEMRLLGQQW